MDKVGADFEMSVGSIREKLVAHPIVLQLPVGAADNFSGIIDLVRMNALFFDTNKLGASFDEVEIPAEHRGAAEQARHTMLELAAEHDEEMMDKYVHDKPIDMAIIERAIRKGTLAGKLHPVFCGSALQHIGIQRLLDSVVAYLPSPLDRPPIVAHKPGDETKKIAVKCDPDGSLVALAFKIVSDSHGDLNFIRIYQGTLKSGTRVLNTTRDRRENITRLFEMHASDRKILEKAHAGDIVAVVGPKHTITGDTLCDAKKPVLLESITFPHTVISMSIEPRTAADKNKLANALEALRREDPTFESKVDHETGQMVIGGMGELHLEILQHKLEKEWGVDIKVGTPRVAYKEAITRIAEAEGKFVRQTGGRGQYGHVILRVEPMLTEDGHWSSDIAFVNEVGGDRVPREYVGAVDKGAKDALGTGTLGGYPVMGVRVTLIDGSYHTVDSSDIAFEQAAGIAIKNVLEKAGPVILEPVMKVEVTVPEVNLGMVQASLLAKRGFITDSKAHGKTWVVDAKVPLSEMFGYSSEIRSATAGRGTFTMEPCSYERVPQQLAEQLII